MIKISFTGDLMSLIPENKAAYNKGVYDYRPVFSKIAPILQEADYVIGNLETPIGGEALGFSTDETVFNTPSDFAKAAADAGFRCFSLANNHCLDRGIIGLDNTIDYLDSIGIVHVGAYKTLEDSKNIPIVEVAGKRIALLSYTYGTNSEWRNNKLSKENSYRVDLLREQSDFNNIIVNPNLQRIKSIIKRILPQYLREKIKPIIVESCVKTEETFEDSIEYYNKIAEKIAKAKEKSDVVIMLLHCGGQYNSKVDNYTKSVCHAIIDLGCDLVVTNHPHVILPYEKYKGKLILYSLGNFCFTPGFGYYYKGVCADYSLIFNLYLDKNGDNTKTSVQICKSVTEKDGHSVVYPLYDLIKQSEGKKKIRLLKDLKTVLTRFYGDKADLFNKVLSEYPLS